MKQSILAQVDIGQQYLLNNRPVDSVFPTVGTLFSTILFNVYTIIGIVLVFILLFGGITFIIGSKDGNKAATAKGKGAITAAMAGFFIVVFSYFIIQLIETITGIEILNSTL